MSLTETIELALDELGTIADTIALTVGGAVRPAAQVSGIVLHGASGIVGLFNARDLEAIRQSRELGTAAGRAAWEAGRLDLAIRCHACGLPYADCGRPRGVLCCAECTHPSPWTLELHDAHGPFLSAESLAHTELQAAEYAVKLARSHPKTVRFVVRKRAP